MDALEAKRPLAFSIDRILSPDLCKPISVPYSPYTDHSCSGTSPVYDNDIQDLQPGTNPAYRSGTPQCRQTMDDDKSQAAELPDTYHYTSAEEVQDCDEDREGDATANDCSSKCKSKKKTRTVFSRQQVFYLEAAFDAKRYLSSNERSEIANSLNLTETQVKVWFQNRRNKWKAQLNSDGKGHVSDEAVPIYFPPFLCGSIASAHAQSGRGVGIPTMPYFRQPLFY